MFLLSSLLYGASCPKEPPVYFSIKHREARGIGYDEGFSSVTGLVIPKVTDRFVPFIDGRLHVFNSGRFASNMGIGARYGLPWRDWVVGANAFWDHREIKHLRVDGLGVGVEALSSLFDIRINGYVPKNNTGNKAPIFDRFSGHEILTKQKYFMAFPSIFGEVGFTIPVVNVYCAAGPYHLFERKIKGEKRIGDAWGIKGRLEAQVTSGFSLAIEGSYDRCYKGILQGVAKLSFPLGAPNTRKGSKRYHKECQVTKTAILTQPVERNEIIPIGDRNIIRPLIDPRTGRPFSIIFVNNTNPTEGLGTFENPYWSTLLAEQNSSPGSIIYVFAGDGTTFRMDTGYVFQESQYMTSSALGLSLAGIAVPAFTPGQRPVTTNTNGGSAFTLADNVTLRGFTIDGADQHGVVTTGTSGSVVEQNVIQNNTLYGIDVSGSNQVTIQFNEMTGNVQHGIFSGSSVAGGGDYLITQNNIHDNSGMGIFFNLVTEDRITITNNTFASNGQNGIQVFGLFFPPTLTTLGPTTTISGNTISGQAGLGISYFFGMGVTHLEVTDNIVFDNQQPGMVIIRNRDFSDAIATANVSRNIVSDHLVNNAGIQIDTRSHLSIDVQDNVLNSIHGPGSNELRIVVPNAPLTSNPQMCGRLINNTSNTGLVLDNNVSQPVSAMQIEAPNPPSLATFQTLNPNAVVTEAVANNVTYVVPGTACP
ncbi:MAG: right-handed parallel beta-helix repeat-containing protein [Chlamydiia bacterium]|nr:right-handed parallel beta-helix repeat-containing protein [Chlamydiia bacterium]